MVIIASKEGQLANRIWHASSFIANAWEYQYQLVHPFFADYYPFFSESLSSNNRFIRFWQTRKSPVYSFFRGFFTYSVRILMKLELKKLPYLEIIKHDGYEQDPVPFDLNDKNFIKKARSKMVLTTGWLFQDIVNLEKHRQMLVKIWTPNKNYRENIEQYYNKYKKGHDLVIGVHIRRGDYEQFEGGRWYYTPEEYYKKIEEVAALEVFRSKKIAFVICTNEKIISFPTSGIFSVFNEKRHFVEDLYLLAKSDYIMGPPSTFSMWASFYGNVPLYKITEIEKKISDQDFEAKPVRF